MSDDSARDTSSSAVKTYVPAYQKTEWEEQASALGMSLSEFARSMIQAGRHVDAEPANESTGVDGFDARVVSVLTEEEYCSWDDLVADLTSGIEGRLENALDRLQTENRVRYSGRHDGYTLVEADQ